MLKDIDGIAIHYPTEKDVVRHHLVQQIILALRPLREDKGTPRPGAYLPPQAMTYVGIHTEAETIPADGHMSGCIQKQKRYQQMTYVGMHTEAETIPAKEIQSMKTVNRIIYFTNEQDRLPVTYKLKMLVRRAVVATLEHEQYENPCEVSVTFTDDEGIRARTGSTARLIARPTCCPSR